MWTIGIALVSLLVDQALLASITPDAIRDSASSQKQRPSTNDLKTHGRVARNSDDPFIEYPDDDDYDEAFNNPTDNRSDDYPEINKPTLHEGPDRFLNFALGPQNRENVEEFSGENSDVQFGFDQSNNLQCGDFIDGANTDLRTGLPLGCQRPSDQPADPNLGMQPFQVYSPNQPPIMIPMQYGYPPMPMLPQGNSYPSYPLQQLPMQPGYGSQMIFLREPNQNIQKNIPIYYTTPSLKEFTNSSSAIDPRLVALSNSHSHTFTHTHTRQKDGPFVPRPPIVRPNINLHVIQNQNSIISPHKPHAAILQPGFHTHGEKFWHEPPFSGGKVPIPIVGPPAASQSQIIKTFGHNGNHHLIGPNPRGSTMHQSQHFFQSGPGFMSVIGMNKEQLDPSTQDNEKIGTFHTGNLQMSPLPTLPQNLFELSPEEQRDAMEHYFRAEQRDMREFLDRIDENNRRNMEMLSEMIHANPTHHLDFESSPYLKENMNDEESELSGSTQDIDNQMEDMMRNELEGYPGSREAIDSAPSNLGHIINVPYKHESESDWLMRFSRSLNKTNTETLDKLLLIEREVIDQLKKDAKHDEDLMIIGYIGENMITDVEKKRNETKRTKREIGGINYNLPVNSLFVDPRAKLDVPKTLDNLGAVAKETFEHERAPLYHVRNIMGSAQDAVMATIKIPTKNFLVPSQYDIVNTGQRKVVPDVNPKYFERENPQPIPDTFQRVGSMIRSSVLSGQEALGHVGEVANHAKNAIHSTRYMAPRFMSKGIPVVTKQPRKLTLIAPRILGVANSEVVGTRENPQREFVKIGNIFDAVGISKPNSDVKFKKIVMRTRGGLSGFRPDDSVQSKNFQDLLGVNVEDYEKEEEEQLVDTINALGEMKDSMGVENMKDFFSKVKRNLKEASQMETMEPNYHPEPTLNEKHETDSFEHPFPTFINQNEHLGPVLGAINPIMFEKLFNESLVTKSGPHMPDTLFRHQDMWKRDSTEEPKNQEKLGTAMKFTEPMLKPFMGRIRMNDDVPQKYVLDLDEIEEGENKDETQR